MKSPTLGDKLRIARLGARRLQAGGRTHLPSLGLIGRRLVRPVADELLFVPPDLRPADPSVFQELSEGQLGLAGQVYSLGQNSPFALASVDPEWEAELHSFAWLGGLRETATPEAQARAQQLVEEWCQRNRGRAAGSGLAARPDVLARRVRSWIVNAGFLLDGASPGFHHLFCRTLGASFRALDANRGLAAPGYPTLSCLLSLMLACLAIAGHDRDLKRIEGALLAEMDRQILGDGGHISRNSEIVVELLLDLLPVRQCYVARGQAVPANVNRAIGRMMLAVKAASTTTRELARFNGVGLPRADALATVLALDREGTMPSTGLGPSRYARLECGATVLIADCGSPPPIEYAVGAHAGCLSFELAHANTSVIVNRGAPGPGYRAMLPDARATASHSTLTVGEVSSAQLIRANGLQALTGALPVKGPDRVDAHVEETDAGLRLVAWHDGYFSRFGLIHERRLTLSWNGLRLDGVDRLRPRRGTLRLSRDVPFAAHFHLPPEVRVSGHAKGAVVLEVPGQPTWRLAADNCHISIEAATDFAQLLGPTPARQVVLRAACAGEAELTWQLERSVS